VLALALGPAPALAAGPDGTYAGKDVTFKVTGDGTFIRAFHADMTAFCIGPTIDDNQIVAAEADVRKVRIKADGTFKKTVKVKGVEQTLRGTLVGHKVKRGRIDISYATCDGRLDFTAKRT
jgi:hypothetical protein